MRVKQKIAFKIDLFSSGDQKYLSIMNRHVFIDHLIHIFFHNKLYNN